MLSILWVLHFFKQKKAIFEIVKKKIKSRFIVKRNIQKQPNWRLYNQTKRIDLIAEKKKKNRLKSSEFDFLEIVFQS